MAGLDYTTRDKVLWGALAALCLASAAAYVFWALPAMPETVPTHWGVDGTADGWDSKGSTVFMGVIMPILMLALLFAVPFFDPRGTSFNRFKGIYQGFSATFTVFMIIMAWLTPATALGLIPESGSFVSTLVFGFFGLLLVGLGVAMPHIEPNYTFGVRIPWTLNDSDNWRRTHGHARGGVLLGVDSPGRAGGGAARGPSRRCGARHPLQLSPLEGRHPIGVARLRKP